MNVELKLLWSRKRNVFLLIGILSVLVTVFASYYFAFEKQSIQNAKYSELKAIASLKVSHIVNWNKERMADIKVFSNSPFFVKSVKKWIGSNLSSSLRSELIKRMSLITEDSVYSNIVLTDAQGNLLLTVDSKFNKVDPLQSAIINRVVKEKKIINTDLYISTDQNIIYIDYIAPVLDENNAVIAVIIFRINPDTYLYPLIKEWPTPSKTSETMIVRKENNNVLYVNELSHQKNTALKLRIPLVKNNVPAVRAALGAIGIFEGISYHGTSVIAYIWPIPGTTWIMIAQVDESEIFSGLYFREIAIIAFTILTIIIFSFGLLLFYHYRQKNAYKELFIKEKELREYHEEFRTILYSIGDGVITADTNGKIKQMNTVAEDLTGWFEKEAMGKPIEEVFNIVNETTRIKVENPIVKVLQEGVVVGLANHTILISKDGKETPIADSGSPIRDEKGKIEGVVLVFRDKTKEHQAENLIRQSEARLRRAELASKSGNWELHIDTKVMIASAGAENIYGLHGEQFEYDIIKKMPLPEYRSSLDNAMSKLIERDEPYNVEFKIKKADTNDIIDIYSVAEYDKEQHVLFGVIQDISERKKLEQSRFQLLNIIEKSLNEIYVFDSITFKFEYVNNCALENLGYSLQEMIQLTPIDIKPEFTQKTFIDAVNPLIKGESEKLVFETIHKRKDGSKYPVEIHLQLHDLGYKCVFFAIINDITERKRTLAELRKNEAFLNNLIETIPIPVFFKDKDKKYIGANKAFISLFGYTREQLIGKSVYDLYPKELADVYYAKDEELFAASGIQIYESVFAGADGKLRDVIINKAVFTNYNGETEGLIGAIQDVTERKYAEKTLRMSEERFRTTLYSIGDGVIATDEFGNIQHINPIAEQLTGWNESEAKNKPLEDIFKIINEETRTSLVNPVHKVLKEGKIVGLANHTLLISKTGKEVPITDSGAPIRNATGDINGVVLVFRDQTKERETQNEIMKSLKEKEILLKEVHHRVKNNFQTIISLIVLQTQITEDNNVLSIFEDLQTRLRSMSLIHELMYGSGNFSAVDIKDYIEKLSQNLVKTYLISERVKLNLDLQNNNLNLDTIIPCGLIVNEIITNSLKYAFPNETTGNIYVTFKKEDNEYCLNISDDGVGIKEKIDFENTNSLGLRLIDLLTQQLGGTLEVIQPEKGLQFLIKFEGEN